MTERYSYEEPVSAFDKYGKFYGIALLLIALMDFFSDPPIFTILLSIAIMGGAVVCLTKKYKLKGFTIAALVLAIFCIMSGFIQANKFGLFKTPKSGEYKEIIASKAEKDADLLRTNKDDSIKSDVEEKSPVKEETVAKEEASEKEESHTKEGGVDPDLKAFLDSYESFMDEYVDFMKKYQADPTNAINMMSEYTDMLTEYSDFVKKADAYDQDKLSNEDLAYYIDTMARIEKKMLSVMQ